MPDTAKHTPGPWKLLDPKDVELLVGRPRRDIDIHTGCGVICSSDERWIALAQVVTHMEGHKHSAGLANACLIAAAPELLEALHRIVNPASGVSQKAPAWVYGIAKAAIAKAEGR